METIILIVLGVVIGAVVVGILSNFAFFGGVLKGEKSTLDKIVIAVIAILAIIIILNAIIGS